MKMMRRALVLAASLSLGLASAQAAVVTFFGADDGVGAGGAFTNANSAAAAFDAATTNSIITFEGATLPNVATGVSVTGAGLDASFSGIQTTSVTTLGFNTTASGNAFLQYAAPFDSATGGSWTFNFTTPISAFGAYFTGTEANLPGPLTISFNDGVPQQLSITKNSIAGVLFFGFTDSNGLFNSVTISGGATTGDRDIFGIDDVRFSASAVPIPGALPLFVTGLGALGLLGWRRKRKAKGCN
jgi:hypothetical protein